MANTFGLGTDTTGFSSTVHNAIQKRVTDTLRAGLVFLPRGAVTPAQLMPGNGENFTLVNTAYPDLLDGAATNPLTEGVAPAPIKLAVSTQSFTVAQQGAWTKVSDVAQYQSPHNLMQIAVDKIARLAAQTIDNLAQTAVAAHAVDVNNTGPLSTAITLDAKAALVNLNLKPSATGGYYAVTHPYALRGLEGESALNGYIQVAEYARPQDLSAGVVSRYRGVDFITSQRVKTVLGAALPTGTVVASTGVFTSTAHGLTAGQAIQISSISGGTTGWTLNIPYYVQTVNLTANTYSLAATRGGATVTGATNGTAIATKQVLYPVYFMGAGSMCFGDVSTLQYFQFTGSAPANELNQIGYVGWKGILGGVVNSFSETTDGSATTASAVDRLYTAAVGDGRSYGGL